MNVSFSCSRCQQAVRVELEASATELKCPACGQEIVIPSDAIADGKLSRCVVCPSRELFVRKDFPQRLGVAVVIVGFAISCVTWAYYMTYLTFAVLFATALVDVVLYAFVGEALMCYRCGAMYRGASGIDEHEGFDLETHERYRQQAARLKQAAGNATTLSPTLPAQPTTRAAEPPDA
jgi:DNA-directed RNA polymerase subunit RPC12/RpoP